MFTSTFQDIRFWLALRRAERAPRIVVVTGASAGIGRATAVLFGSRGDKVALLARGARGLAEAAREVEAAGGTALPIEVDMADYVTVEEAARQIESELGPIDVWINNAFATVFAPFQEIRPEEFRRVTDVTFHGYVHGTRAALDRMRPRDRGTIVQAYWPIAAYRCSRRTAAPSMRSRASPSRCAAS